MKRVIKASSSTNRGYLYLTKHGIGPGTLPRDVKLLKSKDLSKYITAIWLDRFLTTKELNYYDIYPETNMQEILDRNRIDETVESLQEQAPHRKSMSDESSDAYAKHLAGDYADGWEDYLMESNYL